MFLPESMSRIVIVGSNSCIDETIEALYDLETVHLIDHTVDADEGFTLGTPRPYSPKASERLLKVRAMEKDLGINKHTKTAPISESEIRSQITSDSVESIEKEVRAVLDKRNDLNQRITELNAKKKNLELLARLPIDQLELYSGYKSIASMVGTVSSDPTAALGDMGEVYYDSSKKEGNVVAVFVKNDDRTKAQNILSENGFMEIPVPEGTGSVKEALAATEAEIAAAEADLEVVQKETEDLFEKHKAFLRASDEELTADAEKGTLPVRIASTKYSFVIDAWVPTKEAENVKASIESRVPQTFVEIEENRGRREEEAEAAEERFKTAPTKMKHGKISKLFEYPTRMVSVPKYNEVDPTVLIAIFLPLFFGFMVGDAGYAIPFIILGIYGLKYAKLAEWRAIATVLLFGGIWAFIFGFFVFGEALGMHFIEGEHELAVASTWQGLLGLDNLPDALPWLLHGPEFDVGGPGIHKIGEEWVGFLLKLSVYVGVIHLLLGFCLAVYNKSVQHGFVHGFLDKGGQLLCFVGMVILCYGLTAFLGMTDLEENIMYTMMGVGGAIVVVGSILLARAEGAMQIIVELPDTIGIILSYTRLTAICMSKAGMALAFNYIAIEMIAMGIGGTAGAIIGFLVFVVLQLMVWTLGILSCGLHALRLQLVEFMIRFYEGDGTEFTPLKFKHIKTISDKEVKEA